MSTETELSTDTKASLLTDLIRCAQEALNKAKAGVPQQSAKSLDLTGRIRWLSQAHQEASRILSDLAKLLGHITDTDASLIQRVIDNQNVENGVRRRLEE